MNKSTKPETREGKLELLENIRNAKVEFESGAYRLETIPSVYTDLFDISSLDLTISPRHAYNNTATADESRAEGMYRKGEKDHYHGLGAEEFMEAIERIMSHTIYGFIKCQYVVKRQAP